LQIEDPPIIENEDETCKSHCISHNKEKNQMLKINMLSISLVGTFIGIGGIALYLTRSIISSRVRYFLPIPPIGVAAYVFVFNMFRFYNATLPSFSTVVIEMLLSKLAAASIFFFLVVSMTVSIWLVLSSSQDIIKNTW
jgi:hypothetical protein